MRKSVKIATNFERIRRVNSCDYSQLSMKMIFGLTVFQFIGSLIFSFKLNIDVFNLSNYDKFM